MKHRYLPQTEQDQKEMLDVIGVRSIDELFQISQRKLDSKEHTTSKKPHLKQRLSGNYPD